jgi:hypothetical protein
MSTPLSNTPIIDFLAPRFRTLDTSPFQRLRQILSNTPARRHTWEQLSGKVDPYRAEKLVSLAEPQPAFKGFFTGAATINSIGVEGWDAPEPREPRSPSECVEARSWQTIGANEEPEQAA